MLFSRSWSFPKLHGNSLKSIRFQFTKCWAVHWRNLSEVFGVVVKLSKFVRTLKRFFKPSKVFGLCSKSRKFRNGSDILVSIWSLTVFSQTILKLDSTCKATSLLESSRKYLRSPEISASFWNRYPISLITYKGGMMMVEVIWVDFGVLISFQD